MTYPVGTVRQNLNSNKKGYVMNNSKILELKKPAEISADPLTELLRNGARKLITEAVEAELQELLAQYEKFRNEQGPSVPI